MMRKTLFPGRKGLLEKLTGALRHEETHDKESIEMNDYDRLYLSLAEKGLQESFTSLVYTHDVHSINDLERMDTKKIQSRTPWQSAELFAAALKNAKSLDFNKLAMNIGKVDYEAKLKEDGIPIISLKDLSITQRIGRGPYSGIVNEATWAKPNREKMKVCLRFATSTRQSQNFLHEAKMLTKLKHDNIIKLHGVVVFGAFVESIGLVLELCPHGNIIEGSEILTVHSLCKILPQAVSVLQYIASKNLIHFGLSDAAVFLFAKDKIKISAFWGCHPQEKVASISPAQIPWLGNSTIRNKADMVAWFAYFAERVCHVIQKSKIVNAVQRKESAGKTYFSLVCPEVMYTLLDRCSKASHKLGRPSLEEIMAFVTSKSFPPIVQMTGSYTSTAVGDLSFDNGEQVLLISKNCTRFVDKSHKSGEDLWFGEKEDGQLGLFDSSMATILNPEVGPTSELSQQSVPVADGDERPPSEELSGQVPVEITARGPEAEHAYRKALLEGKVQVYRGRIMLIGQDRAGKTSLKKSLLGLPFDPREVSTEGIEVDPSTFEVDIDQVKNWRPTSRKALASEFADDIARIMVDELTRKEPEEKQQHDELHQSQQSLPDHEHSSHDEQTKLNQDDSRSRSDTPPLPNDVAEEQNETTFSCEASASKELSAEEPEVSLDNLQIKIQDAIPEDVTNLVIQYLQNVDINQEYPASRETVVSIWDFAGQHLYYASHPVFLSPRAVYLLVYNLKKDLNAEAEPCVRQGVYDVLLENPDRQTNLEGILSWLVSIHSIQRGDEDGDSDVVKDEGKTDQKLPYLRPPVIIVGTHEDMAFEDPKKMEMHIKKSLQGKSYQQHVVKPFVVVNNTLSSGDKGVQLLQKTIGEVLRTEPYMGEDVPVRWFNFEKVVETLVQGKTYHLALTDLERIVNEVCFIDDSREISAMLNFYHDLGVIVMHGGTVVLQAQWLIDLFRRLITIRPFDEQNALFAEYWAELEENGILHMALAEHVFSEVVASGHSQEDILAMMEHYGLIARFNIIGGSDSKRYFVPAQLSSSPEGIVDVTPSPGDACALYVHFQDGFVPHGLYTMLISKFISWISSGECKNEPNLYRNVSRFIIGAEADYELIIVCRKSYIKIVLQSIATDCDDEEAATVSRSPVSRSPAPVIRAFIEQTLQDMSLECPWLRNMRYQFCVMCPSCIAGPKPCQKHRVASCADDDCIHLLPINSGRVLICKKSYGKGSRPKAHGLEDWYQIETSSEPLPKSGSSIVSRDTFMLLAREIGPAWKALGRALLLDNAELDQIEADEKQLYEQSFLVLRRWHEINASAATLDNLGRALVKVGRGDLGRKHCGDALQGAEACAQDSTDSAKAPIPVASPSSSPPVFLSYQWDMQKTALELGRQLREAGIECWMDVGQMGGGDFLYASIDAGVRGAKVMLCCVTSRYCASENCQCEATLGGLLKKPIIPLLFEEIPWPPAGQLGPVFAKLLYIDMTQCSENIPSQKFQELVQRIEKYCSK
ncbi:uncharacterized protein LOC5519167 isoform X1 [Nematostella vectensis]|uniref:uncharacterized protein LOC5519167 isoform X1 n=1 Tax=Nematostella vectensis TaxID=45351 RepID=UPI002077107C|nr:uncharacterized protein LOC5519167 isoform X1 [Nematostella vectensis]